MLNDAELSYWRERGVAITDPDIVTIDDGVQIGRGSVIEGENRLKGKTIIGENVLLVSILTFRSPMKIPLRRWAVRRLF